MQDTNQNTNYFRPVVGDNIRRIIINTNSNEFSFHVGQVLHKSGLEITRIERNEDARYLFGQVYYIIFVRKLNEVKESPWKYVHGVSCIIENFI